VGVRGWWGLAGLEFDALTQHYCDLIWGNIVVGKVKSCPNPVQQRGWMSTGFQHKTKSPFRGYLVNFKREMMEARAGVEPTYTDLQSGA
jgi:hypothetical protein